MGRVDQDSACPRLPVLLFLLIRPVLAVIAPVLVQVMLALLVRCRAAAVRLPGLRRMAAFLVSARSLFALRASSWRLVVIVRHSRSPA